MKEREELELILKLIGKYNLPLSPILEYAVKEKMEEYPEEEQTAAIAPNDVFENNDVVKDIFISNEISVDDLSDELRIVDYRERTIAVVGNTKPHKDALKSIGGHFVFRTPWGPAWVFQENKRDIIQAYIEGDTSVITCEEKENQEDLSPTTEDIFEDFEVEHVIVDSRGNNIQSDKDISGVVESESRRCVRWTEEEELNLKHLFHEGKDFAFIAKITGRSEIAIKSRLAKLGLIEYTYGQDDYSIKPYNEEVSTSVSEQDFTIMCSFERSSIVNKNGEVVFVTDGKLKYIKGKLYRLNLKNEFFTLKSMQFDGVVWQKGIKKIVAYSRSDLFKILIFKQDYSSVVEDIVDSPVFEECKLKVNGIWFDYQGKVIIDDSSQNLIKRETPIRNNDFKRIKSNPLYAVRKQAIFRAFSLLKAPATLKDITRSISRTAWRSPIYEGDVKEIIDTISEVNVIDGKYVLQKK